MNFNDFFVHILNTLDLILNVLRIRRQYKTDVTLDDRVVVITGANTGLGKETAFELSLRGAQIMIGCRDLVRAEDAIKHIKDKNPNAKITALKLDLSSLESVRQFAKSVAEEVSKIDILINNAGIALCPQLESENGFELQLATNHLGHFLLTLSLMPLLKKSSKCRVITLSSLGHSVGEIDFSDINLRNKYRPLKAYNRSKLANVLFTRELSRRLGPHNSIKTYCLHPGVVRTELSRVRGSPQSMISSVFQKLFLVSPQIGVQTTLYCALEPTLDNESGKYYNNCSRVDRMVSQAVDDDSAQKLWELSCDLVKLEDNLRI